MNSLEKHKQKILKLIEKSDSFLVIYSKDNSNTVEYSDYNIDNGDIISHCEVVKAKILKKVVK